MTRYIALILLLINTFNSKAQAPEIWGVSKSTLSSNEYYIYKTDTSLANPVTIIKTINSTFEGIPNGGLVKGIADSLIYGFTIFPSGNSNIYQINTTTNVYSVKTQITAAQGDKIVGELIRHPNGKYYGMTNGGGNSNKGVIFEWDAVANLYTVKHHFNGTNGAYPRDNASLRYCNTDGYFYGLTLSGGTSNYGVLFRYNPTSGIYQVIENFTYSNGIEPNGAVQILEFPNGDLNLLYSLMFGNSNNWGTLCNTRYTNASGTFTTTYHSFSGLYFFNNTQQLSNPIGDIIKVNGLNSNNHNHFIGIAATSTSNDYTVFSFAVNSTTKQIYTNTTFQFSSNFPTHSTIRTADNFVQSGFSNGLVYGVTNGLNFQNPNGSFIRKYKPLDTGFSTSLNIYNSQNMSNEIFGGRPYIHTYTPCISATTPVLSSSSPNVCNNNPVTLSISSGSLNNSNTWKWYNDSCGGTLIGTGTSITVNQSYTTDYYARGEGGCTSNGGCGQITVYCVPGGTELFFSEYIEGTASNKALEIFNPTPAPINLSSYTVEMYINGSSTPSNTQALSGTLAGGDVYIIANSAAAAAFTSVADITSAVCNFNGDDAVVLKKNNVVIDVIGVVGVDPGANWITSGGGATSGYTLVRDSTIKDPETNWSIAQNQWYAYPANTSIYLGSHTMSLSSTSINSINWVDPSVLYPNPGNGLIYLKTIDIAEVTIISDFGAVVYQNKFSPEDSAIDISNLPSGVYFVHVGSKHLKYIKL